MPLAYESPAFTLVNDQLPNIDADFLVLPVTQDQRDFAEPIDKAVDGELGAAYARGEFHGKPCELWQTQLGDAFRTRRVAVIGVGPRAELTVERVRRMAACGAMAARQQRRSRLAFYLPHDWTDELWIEAVAEGATFANFDNGHYKSKPEGRFFISSVAVAGLTVAAARFPSAS